MKIIRKTQSICPECFKPIDAEYIERNGIVYFEKDCPDCGHFSTLAANNAEEFIWWDNRPVVNVPPKKAITKGAEEAHSECPLHCGTCENHLQTACCIIIDVTKRCNQHCPYCFARADEDDFSAPEPTLKEIERKCDVLLELGEERPFNIQLSGGEPTVRDDLPEIIELIHSKGFEYIQINSNGKRIAEEEDYALKLKRAGASVVFMQFDGTREDIYMTLRGEKLLNTKKRAIINCRKAGLPVTIVPTIVKGVNDDNIGGMLQFLLYNIDVIKGIHFQPVSYFGRRPEKLSSTTCNRSQRTVNACADDSVADEAIDIESESKDEKNTRVCANTTPADNESTRSSLSTNLADDESTRDCDSTTPADNESTRSSLSTNPADGESTRDCANTTPAEEKNTRPCADATAPDAGFTYPERTTMYDIMHAIADQNPQFSFDDFCPINTGHPQCCFYSTYLKEESGKIKCLISAKSKTEGISCCEMTSPNTNQTNANLPNSNLSNANLSNANPPDASLSNTNPANSNPSNANPANSNPSNANPLDANPLAANLSNANPLDANLSNANPPDASEPADFSSNTVAASCESASSSHTSDKKAIARTAVMNGRDEYSVHAEISDAERLRIIKKDRDFVLKKWDLPENPDAKEFQTDSPPDSEASVGNHYSDSGKNESSVNNDYSDSNKHEAYDSGKCESSDFNKREASGSDKPMTIDEFLDYYKRNTFTITGMAFQDASNLDAERLKRCRVQVLTDDDRLVPFCGYVSLN